MLKRKILNFLLKYLYNAITEDDVLKYDRKEGLLVVGDKVLSYKHLNNLQSDIKVMRQLDWWKFLKSDIKNVANKKMYENSKSVDDMVFGKAVLYTLDVMDRKMDNFLKLK